MSLYWYINLHINKWFRNKMKWSTLYPIFNICSIQYVSVLSLLYLKYPCIFHNSYGFYFLEVRNLFHSNLYEVPRKANATNNPNPFIHNVEKWPNIL